MKFSGDGHLTNDYEVGVEKFIKCSIATIFQKGWVVATKVQLWDAYDTSLPTNDEASSNLNEVQPNTEDIDDTYQEMESFTPWFLGYQSNQFNDEVNFRRDDMEKIVVDVPN